VEATKATFAAVVVLGLVVLTAGFLVAGIATPGPGTKLMTLTHFGSAPQSGSFLVTAQAGRESVLSAAGALVADAESTPSQQRSDALAVAAAARQAAAALNGAAGFGVQMGEGSRIEAAYRRVAAAASTLAQASSAAYSADYAALNVALAQMSSIQEVP
jgi:hypothetical protein